MGIDKLQDHNAAIAVLAAEMKTVKEQLREMQNDLDSVSRTVVESATNIKHYAEQAALIRNDGAEQMKAIGDLRDKLSSMVHMSKDFVEIAGTVDTIYKDLLEQCQGCKLTKQGNEHRFQTMEKTINSMSTVIKRIDNVIPKIEKSMDKLTDEVQTYTPLKGMCDIFRGSNAVRNAVISIASVGTAVVAIATSSAAIYSWITK